MILWSLTILESKIVPRRLKTFFAYAVRNAKAKNSCASALAGQLDLNKAFHSYNNCKHPQITTKYSQKQFYFQPGQFVAKIIF